jgi:hypothetical protein
VCRNDNPIPTRFLASIDCSKIPAQFCRPVSVANYWQNILKNISSQKVAFLKAIKEAVLLQILAKLSGWTGWNAVTGPGNTVRCRVVRGMTFFHKCAGSNLESGRQIMAGKFSCRPIFIKSKQMPWYLHS